MLAQVRRIPAIPARNLRLERRVARRDPLRVDARDLGPMPWLEVGDRDAGHVDGNQQQPALAAGWITGSPRASGSLVFTALTIAPCIPSATSCVNSTDTWSKPAASSPASYSPRESAPAMQPAKLPRSARSSGVSSILGDDVADPDPPTRPEHPRDLGQHLRLVDREVDHAVRDHDIDRVGRQRDLLDHALEQMDVGDARRPRRCDARARASRRSYPGRRRPRSGRPAWPRGSRSIPPPDPRSSTVSPSRSSATAVGLPQPSDASTAALRELAALLGVVQRLAEHVSRLAVVDAARATATAAPVAMLADRPGRLRVAAPNLLAKLICARAHHATASFVVATPIRTDPGLSTGSSAGSSGPRCRQAVRPRPAHHELRRRRKTRDTPLVDPKQAARTAMLDQHETRLREPAQMLRHRRLPHLDRRDDLAHRQRPPLTREQIQDLQPRRIRQTPKPTRKQLRLTYDQSSSIDDKRLDASAQAPTEEGPR